jgi:hypothetical protein
VSGRLAAHGGVVWVARERRRGGVRAYDFDGRCVADEFVVPPLRATRTTITGLAVDADRRLYLVDASARSVRRFNAFGVEQPELLRSETDLLDSFDSLASPVDVAVDGVEGDARVVVACGGERRHALKVHDRDCRLLHSLRPFGDPMGVFHHLARVGVRGRWIAALEGAKDRVQVFRDGEFHYAFSVPVDRRAPAAMVAIEPLEDGGFVALLRGAHGAHLLHLGRAGALERVLADGDAIEEPVDLVVEEGGTGPRTRVIVLDREGARVAVHTLEGRMLGEFVENG